MIVTAFIQEYGPAALVLAITVPLAHVAQRGAQQLVRQIHAELAAETSRESLIKLPVGALQRLFLTWLWLNAVCLVAFTALPLLQCVGLMLLFSVLGMLALVDAETGILPNELVLLLMGLVWLYSWLVSGHWMPRLELLWGMTLGYALPMLFNMAHQALTQRLAMGQGDAKLLAAIGLWLGTRALADVWIGACALLIIYTLGLRFVSQTTMHLRMSIPFGPFLVVAANAIVIRESF